MRAYLLEHPGSPESLRLADLPLPQPGPGEVRVRVGAVGLNPVDYKLIRGGHPAWTYPHLPGLDAAGTVDALGEGVTHLEPGDRVAYHGDLRRAGAFAGYALTTAHSVARIPAGVSLEDAAALPCAGMTAFQSLHHRLIALEGKRLLIHGAAGGVGGFAVQLAHAAGARVLATASPQNHAYVQGLGADAVLDYRDPALLEQVLEWSGGQGLDAVLETAGKDSATRSLDALALGGALVCIAGLPDLEVYRTRTRLPTLHRIALGAAHAVGTRRDQQDLAAMLGELLERLKAGSLRSLVSEVHPFEALPQALAALEHGGVQGKWVVRVEP